MPPWQGDGLAPALASGGLAQLPLFFFFFFYPFLEDFLLLLTCWMEGQGGVRAPWRSAADSCGDAILAWLPFGADDAASPVLGGLCKPAFPSGAAAGQVSAFTSLLEGGSEALELGEQPARSFPAWMEEPLPLPFPVAGVS